MQFTTTLLTLLTATSALAAPTTLNIRTVAAEHATCQAYRNDMVNIN